MRITISPEEFEKRYQSFKAAAKNLDKRFHYKETDFPVIPSSYNDTLKKMVQLLEYTEVLVDRCEKLPMPEVPEVYDRGRQLHRKLFHIVKLIMFESFDEFYKLAKGGHERDVRMSEIHTSFTDLKLVPWLMDMKASMEKVLKQTVATDTESPYMATYIDLWILCKVIEEELPKIITASEKAATRPNFFDKCVPTNIRKWVKDEFSKLKDSGIDEELGNILSSYSSDSMAEDSDHSENRGATTSPTAVYDPVHVPRKRLLEVDGFIKSEASEPVHFKREVDAFIKSEASDIEAEEKDYTELPCRMISDGTVILSV